MPLDLQTTIFTAKYKRELLSKGFTPEEIQQLEIQTDPALWAETYLQNPEKPTEKLILRKHQKIILKSKSNKIVLRIGRRGGKSILLCIKALYKAFTTKDIRVLICTPYKIQTASIWKDGFLKLIKGNPLIESSISRIGQNPFTVEFKNGSRILGLTAGSSTGNKGGSIRGASADYLIMDEVDYMGEEAIQSIMAIAATNKKTQLLISSTPTGRREFFYMACTNKLLGFEEHHYPSSCSPEWISIEEAKRKGLPLYESQEYVFRNMYPEDVYNKEFCAAFGEEAQGVFKHKYIDSSLITYDPNKEQNDPTGKTWFCGDEQKAGNKYSLGVDWNGTKVGVQIVITEYFLEPTTLNCLDSDGKKQQIIFHRKYRPFYRESVSLEEMTQIKSIEKIVELNNRFKIDHMYVDHGYGHLHVEELRLYGKRHPESGICEKLVAIDSGSKVKVYDPFSKEELEKPMKPFMVNNAATCLERNELILPEVEDEKIRLVGQMREYRIKKISVLGHPTYSEDNDHILDAFMLSLLAFQLEYSELIKISYISDIAISTKPSLLMPGLGKVPDRTVQIKQDKLQEMGVVKRQPALNADKYHSDSRGNYMDYEDLVKTAETTKSPFSGGPVLTSWTKRNAPSRATF